MKILHIIGGDLKGGAAKGAYCLHQGLKQIGITSTVLTNSFDTLGDTDVVTIANTPIKRFFSRIRTSFDVIPTKVYPHHKKIIFSTGMLGIDFTKHRLYQDADIINLHWINGGLVNIKHLKKIKKPIVWTMRDMWPMTGGCHVAEALECTRYQSDCGKCIQLGSTYTFDLSRFVLNRKRKYLPHNIVFIGISPWLTTCAQKSSLLNSYDIHTISNNIDCTEFNPIPKNIARNILSIPLDKKIILVGAHDAKVFYKGFSKFLESLSFLNKQDFHLLFFGKHDEGMISSTDFSYTLLGFLHDIYSLRLAYSAADVFVSPSLLDAFGKTIAESMACCTPVVCFNVSGPKHIVDHKQNGYCATPFIAEDLATGVNWVLGNEEKSGVLGAYAREKIIKNFDAPIIANKYKKLYQKILLAPKK